MIPTTLLLLSSILHSTSVAGGNPVARTRQSTPPPEPEPESSFDFNPFPDDEEERAELMAKATKGIFASATTLYGVALLLHGSRLPSHIHILTMMRATGFQKLEDTIAEARKNFRGAIRATIFRAPSLLLARNSVRGIDDRLRDARKVVEYTKKAEADGKITRLEARTIRRMRRRVIRRLHRDMKRIRRASLTIWKVIEVLDIDEILEIIQSFFFQVTAVLASGHADSMIGSIVSHWCYFLTLTFLLQRTSGKFGNPLVRGPVTSHLRTKKLNKDQTRFVRTMDAIVFNSFSAVLVLTEFDLACRLTAALIVASLLTRGLRYLYEFLGNDEDQVSRVFDEKIGGLLIVSFAALSEYFRRRRGSGQPGPLLRPLLHVEKAIQDSIVVMEKLM